MFRLSANVPPAALPSSDVFRLELHGEGRLKASSWDLFCSLSRLEFSRWAISVQKAVWNHLRVTNHCSLL